MRILLVDDQVLFREGLANLMRSQDDLTVVGEAGTVAEAITQARKLKPDVILMDFSLPDGNGPDAAREILAERPKTGIIFLTVHDSDTYLLAAIRSGAMGYLVKDVSFSKVMDAFQAVLKNEPALSPRATLSLMHEIVQTNPAGADTSLSLEDFTSREIDILRDLAADASNQEIARHLSLSVAVVKNKIHQIFLKLNVDSRQEVANFARRQGLARINRF